MVDVTVFSEGITIEIKLYVGCTDDEYLSLLRRNLDDALDEHKPDMVLYNAGTDCLAGDPLGAMNISPEVSVSS